MIMGVGSSFAIASTTIVNMIGKTIQGQFPVSVDGVTLTNPAIVVDGTSFLPVRQFGETVGYAVYFDTEGGVRLEKQTVTDTAAIEERYQTAIKNAEIQRNQTKLDAARKEKARLEKALIESKQKYLDAHGDPDLWETSNWYKSIIDHIADQQAIIDALN